MGNAPDFQSFPLMSGDSVNLNFTVRDNDGAVVDITAGSGRFAMARKPSSATMAIDSDASPATATITIQDGANGLVDVDITDENTESLIGDYYFEFKWADILGNEAVVARGYMSFAKNML